MNRKMAALSLLALSSAVIASAPAAAQWSDDASVNLAIADKSGEQVQAKIVAIPGGGAYVSWLDNNAGGYDVYLQRLDEGGNEQWAHNGVLIADRSFSSTQDYDLDVDATGNALLAFRDDRFTGIQVTAAKVAPDGTLLWGANGVQLTSTTDFIASPKIAATTDGNIVVAWKQEDAVNLRKLDGDGAPVWESDVVLTDPGAVAYAASDLDASDGGGVVIAIVRGFFGASLVAQKLDTDGFTVWGEDAVVVFDGSLQIGNFPQFVPDGAGGAVFGWYSTSGTLQCSVQRVLADGTEKFPHNGLTVSTANVNRVGPSVDFDPATQEIFVFWTELNAGQSAWGVYGQKFSEDGTRMWTNTGKVVEPVGPNERTQVRTLARLDGGGGAYVFWVDKPSPPSGQRVLGSHLDAAGDFVWTPTIIEVSSVLAGKSRLDMTRSSLTGASFLAWMDGRNDANDIYAQNVNPDGTLGPPFGDINGDGVVGFDDLLIVLSTWGPCPTEGDCPADLSGDNEVGFDDLLIVLSNWT